MAIQPSTAAQASGTGSTLNFTTAEIKGMALGAHDSLIITKTDGSTVTLENFKQMSDHGSKLTLSDGQTIDTHKLYDTLSLAAGHGQGANDTASANTVVPDTAAVAVAANASTSTTDATVIGLPQAGQTTEISLKPGQAYVLGFDPHSAASTSVVNGNLVMTFPDGSKVVIDDYQHAMNGPHAASVTALDGHVIHGAELLGMATTGTNDVAGTENVVPKADDDTAATDQQVAQLAQELAAIQPAAGGPAGAAGGGGHGFGFQSEFAAGPLEAIPDVGPIGPTALGFGIPTFDNAPIAFFQGVANAVPPTIEVNNGVHDAIVKEDGSVYVPIVATLGNGAPSTEVLTVTVTGIDSSWHLVNMDGSYDATTGTWTITLPPGQNYSGGLTFIPPANSDVDLGGLHATATSLEPGNGTSASTGTDFYIITDAVADKPVVEAHNNSGNENTTLAVDVSGKLVIDTDGSETITGYKISGVPDGFSFNHGTNLGGGVWSFAPGDMTGLIATAPTNYVGTINLTATVENAETNLSGKEADYSDNTNSASTPFSLTWNPIAFPPTIEVNNGAHDAIVKENGHVFVPVHAELSANASPNEILTVTITGINPAWNLTNTDGHYDAATGTWTITMPAGQNYTGGLTFAPPAYSDVDMDGLTATASVVEPATNTTASASAGFDIITDAVAEAPPLTATSTGGEAGHTIPLTIHTSEVDPDGSEAITKIDITGVPAGATLTAGTDLGGGHWQLTLAQLANLGMNVPKSVSGTVSLTVTSTSQEIHLSGKEVDLTDNTASTTVSLNVNVTPNSIPILAGPVVDTVKEADLSHGTVVVKDTLHANFGADAPGTFAATTASSFKATGSIAGGALTSDGHPVTVTLANGTYTGTADGHTVFTLHVNTDGTYEFDLVGTLDHADKTNPADSIALNFGISATDSDGDTATGTVTVNVIDDAPVAHNDVNTFDLLVGHTDGNVITGLHGGAGAADTLSQDAPDKVTSISFGSTTVTVPDTGTATIHGDHGTLTISSDGSYTYVLDNTGSTAKTFATTNIYPTETEGQALPSGAGYYGIHAGDLTVSTASTATITFEHNGAGYSNAVGTFAINPDGTITSISVEMPDEMSTDVGSSFTAALAAGQTLGFFVIPNAASDYSGIDLSQGTLKMVYDYGHADARAATVNDNGNSVSLVYTDPSGKVTVINDPHYITTNAGGSQLANADDLNHTVSGLVSSGDNTTLRVGLEDLPNGGDKDYNDVVFDISINSTTPATTSTDVFTYGLTDGDGDTSKATLTFNDTLPNVPPPTLVVDNGQHDVVVKENGHVYVPIVATLDPHGPSDQVLTVKVTGIDPSWHLTNADGTYNAATGTWTITLPAGQNYNGGLTFAPPAYSDVDLDGLQVTATATEPVTGLNASSNGSFDIITDAVAEAPPLTATSPGGEAGHAIPVTITTSEVDPDGSEAITKIDITGVPTGATLSHGTDLGGGHWQLTTGDLTGLTLTVPKSYTGSVNLSVTSTSQEIHLSGKEVDTTDNSASTTVALNVNVTPNSNPVLVTPSTDTVKEADLSHGTVIVKDTLHANFGADAPGTFAATTATSFSATGSVAGGALTSDGHPVTVALSGNTYTGTADGHTVFTLTVNSDGTYAFDLMGTLDHADKTNPADSIVLNFGVKATDADGDAATGTVKVSVVDDAPVAHNDVNTFDLLVGHTSGNAVTGVNGGAGAADTLSQDAPNHVTSISFGSQTLTVPDTGTVSIHGDHGTLTIAADGSYTYVLDNSTPGSGSASTTDKVFSTTNIFPTETEGQALPSGQGYYGIKAGDLTVATASTATITYQHDGAGYNNTVGTFLINPDGTITGVSVEMASQDNTKVGSSFTAAIGAGQTLGLFVLANAAADYPNIDFSKGSLKMVYDYGQSDARAATVNDSGTHVSLVYTSTSGAVTVINDPHYITTNAGGSQLANPDDLDHTVSGLVSSGNDTTLRIGLEDLPSLGDKDYNDVVLDVSIKESVPAPTGPDVFTYGLTDGDGDTSKATITFNETPPTVTPPTLVVNGGTTDAVVKEDHSIYVPIKATLDPNGPSDQVLTVKVTGIDSSWHVTNADGTYNAATGTWTITLPAGQNYTGGLTFAPPANSDADISGLHVTATATEPVTGTTQSATTSFNVIGDAVADVPTITTHDSTGVENTMLAVNFSGAVTDTDGSETITGYTISGVPAGVSFNHGTTDGKGNWTFTPADIVGLTATAPHNFVGTDTLSVTVHSAETNLTGKEVDTSDNTNSATGTVHLTWTPAHVPVISGTCSVTVDETNLAKGAVVATGAVTANFGSDTGSFAATAASTFAASGSVAGGKLTSDGHPVTVALANGTYTGTANGATVFTMHVNADGTYAFDLVGTLDHADTTNPNDSIALAFGVTATESDGMSATTSVVVNVLDDAPLAHNDINTFNVASGHTDGNVVTGVNGGSGAADTLSQDAPNHITSVSFGSTTVAVPTTGTATIQGDHGTLSIAADGSYTYTVNGGSNGNSGAVDKVFSTTNLFPTETEGQALPSGKAYYGIHAGDLTVSTASVATVTYVHDGAGYNNTVGTFLINADGTITGVSVEMAAQNNATVGSSFTASIGAGQTLGFFVLANAAADYPNIDFSKGSLKMVYDYGHSDARAATVNDSGSHVSLVYTSTSGAVTVINDPHYVTTNAGGSQLANPDDLDHTVSGLVSSSDHTTLRVGLEDLPCLGDKDYNDVVFDVSIKSVPTTVAGGTDTFTYGLTDGDGDTSKATLTLNGTASTTLSGTCNGVASDNHGVLSGTSHNDVLITGDGNHVVLAGSGNDQIHLGAGSNIAYGGSGADQFIFDAMKAMGQSDHIADFNVSQGDTLDLSHLLSGIGFDPVHSAINNFVFATDTSAGTVIKVDVTGHGNAAAAQTVATLDGVHTDLNTLINHHVVTTA